MMIPLPSLLPLGFRFDPSDEELISYLIRRATGLSLLPSGANHQHIVERQLYGDMANPWHVFHGLSDVHWDIISEMGDDDDEDGKDKRVIYVVTKLTKISKGKTRIARRAGCGTWSGQTPPKKIYDESTGQWVGTMRMLSFERAAKGEEQYHHDPRDQHHWIMHEYSLDGIYNNNNNNNNNNSNKVDKEYVICRITRIFKGNRSRNNDITEGEDVVHVPAAAVTPPSCHPNKKRKREIITQQVDQGRRRYSPHFQQLEHDVVVSISAREEEEEEAHHEYTPPAVTINSREKELGGESSVLVYHDEASNQQQLVEYVSMPAQTMAHHHHDEDEDDADFDKWMSSLDDILLVEEDLPEEPEEEEDHTQAAAAAASNQLQDLVETAQQADINHYEASTTIAAAADWMTLLDDVQLLPDDDEDDEDDHLTTGQPPLSIWIT